MKRLLLCLALLVAPALAQDKKISELPDGSPGQATDAVPIARAGANYRLPFSAFAPSFFSITGTDSFHIGTGTMLAQGAKTISIGDGAGVLIQVDGNTNTILGASSGTALTTGYGNTFIGANAALTCATGVRNTIIGVDSNCAAAGTTHSVAIGRNATAGSYATAIGNYATAADYTFIVAAGNGQVISNTTYQGGQLKVLADGAAATPVIRVPLAFSNHQAGEVIWHAESAETNRLTTVGRIRFAAAREGATVACAVNVIGTDLTARTGGANTLICTWTAVPNSSNCDLSATCTDDIAGSQYIEMYVRSDMTTTVTLVYP